MTSNKPTTVSTKSTAPSTCIALALFLTSSIFYHLYHLQRLKRCRMYDSMMDDKDNCSGKNTESNDEQEEGGKRGQKEDQDEIMRGGSIGRRGASSLKKTPPYWEGFLAYLKNPYDTESNPTGDIALCIAENKLVQESLAIRLMQDNDEICQAAFSDEVVYCYNSFLGLPTARAAVAYFLEKRFLRTVSSTVAEEKVKEEGEVIAFGNNDDGDGEGKGGGREGINSSDGGDNDNKGGRVGCGDDDNTKKSRMTKSITRSILLSTQRSLQKIRKETTATTTTTTPDSTIAPSDIINDNNKDDASDTTNHHSILTLPPPPRIDPNHIVIGAGIGSLLHHLVFILAERGDVVLVPAPYYTGFEYDIGAVPGCVLWPVVCHSGNGDPCRGPMVSDLELAARAVEKEGKKVKILLLTNPNDPLGIVYKDEVVASAIRWARHRKMHTIVDEIYALSDRTPNSHPNHFYSVLNTLTTTTPQPPTDVHFLWSLSKDFGASGFRFGILYTCNVLLLRALANLNIFSGVSHPLQIIVSKILCDDRFVDAFLQDARIKLECSWRICTSKLDEMVVPYVCSYAGLCVYADFSGICPKNMNKKNSMTVGVEEERIFAKMLRDVCGVVLTPGWEGLGERRGGGWMRICYTWVGPEVLEVAMERISRAVLLVRRVGWDDYGVKEWREEAMRRPIITDNSINIL